jgi:hypothetical protein
VSSSRSRTSCKSDAKRPRDRSYRRPSPILLYAHCDVHGDGGHLRHPSWGKPPVDSRRSLDVDGGEVHSVTTFDNEEVGPWPTELTAATRNVYEAFRVSLATAEGFVDTERASISHLEDRELRK